RRTLSRRARSRCRHRDAFRGPPARFAPARHRRKKRSFRHSDRRDPNPPSACYLSAGMPRNDGGTASGLDVILSAGGARWPGFGLTLADLQAYADKTALADSALQHAADVLLVCACLKGVAAAISALDRTIRENVPMFLRRIDRD